MFTEINVMFPGLRTWNLSLQPFKGNEVCVLSRLPPTLLSKFVTTWCQHTEAKINQVQENVDGLVQACSNSSALVMELL